MWIPFNDPSQLEFFIMARSETTSKKNDAKAKINLLLVLFNFYENDMPSWPEVMGIYGNNLSKKGHKIDWIMPFKRNMFSRNIKKKFFEVNIYLLPFTRSKNFIAIVISCILYYILLLNFLLLYGKNYDIIQVRDDVFAAIFVIIVCILYNKKFTFNYSFPSYEAALDANQLYPKKISPLLLYWKLYDIVLRKVVLKKADHIFPISNEMIDQLRSIGLSQNKMHAMPLGIEPTNFIVPKLKKLNRETLGFNKNDFIFVYVGSLNKIRGLDIIINAFSKVINPLNNIKLMFVGSGDGAELLREVSKNVGLEKDIRFIGKVSYSLVPEYIHLSDACLSIIKPLRCYYVCSPCKLFEYLYIGRPVIANEEIPEHKRIIQSSNGGLLVKYDEESIANAMLDMVSIYNNPDKYKQLSESGRKWVIENRTFNVISREIEDIYLNLIN